VSKDYIKKNFQRGPTRRKRRIKPILDPNVEKELALKQLMDFETKKSTDRMKRMIRKPKSPEEEQNTPENKQPENEPEKKVAVKRAYSLSSVPKRFPKKYQRIIKRQLRSSKLKAKSITSDTPQKKLPEVPEVQIAIDKYIKTYTNKRKHKPDNGNTEIPDEKKVKEANSATPATPKVLENSNAKNVETPMEADSADENRNEADISDLEAKKDDTPKPKANSKVMREINRLLGDEGAINMIYSIEQKRIPGNKNDSSVLPSTRRKKKDLLLKTKLVKNAVLRLSMSSSQTSPARGRRSSPEAPATASVPKPTAASSASPLRKASIESMESGTSEVNSPKTRKVAAEASKIIRRHSSSSAYSTDEDEPPAKQVTTNNTDKESVVNAEVPTTSSVSVTTPTHSNKKTVAAVTASITPEKISAESAKSINDAKGKSPKTSSRRTSKESLPIEHGFSKDKAKIVGGIKGNGTETRYKNEFLI
jgi:hypothetical protein